MTIDNFYTSCRFVVFLLSIPVISILLNAVLQPQKGDKWNLAKKLVKPLLIFSFAFLGSGSVYLSNKLGIIDIGTPIGGTLDRIFFQFCFMYAFWSCIDAFIVDEEKKVWKFIMAGIFACGVILFGVLEVL